MKIELTYLSSAHERYDTDANQRVEAALRAVEGVRYLYGEGGCGDMEAPDGAENHHVIETEDDALAEAVGAVQHLTGRGVHVRRLP